MLYTQRVDDMIEQQAATIARAPAEQMLWTVNTGFSNNLHRVTISALKPADARRFASDFARALRPRASTNVA